MIIYKKYNETDENLNSKVYTWDVETKENNGKTRWKLRVTVSIHECFVIVAERTGCRSNNEAMHHPLI